MLRRPEETVLYRLAHKYAQTLFTQVESETGTGLPYFVKVEFDAYLECDILVECPSGNRACLMKTQFI